MRLVVVAGIGQQQKEAFAGGKDGVRERMFVVRRSKGRKGIYVRLRALGRGR